MTKLKNDLSRDIYDKNNPTPFLEKHHKSFVTGYLINEEKSRKALVETDKKITLIGYALIFSILLNIYQAHKPSREHLKASLSDNRSDIVNVTSIPFTINSVPIVLSWTTNSVISALTIGFSTYNNDIEKSKKIFTPAGYSGFMDAIDKNIKDNILNNRMDLTTIPTGPAIMSHMYTAHEPYWIIQIPVIMNYSVGIASKDISYNQILSLKVVPVRAGLNDNGKAIDSITLTTQ